MFSASFPDLQLENEKDHLHGLNDGHKGIGSKVLLLGPELVQIEVPTVKVTSVCV